MNKLEKTRGIHPFSRTLPVLFEVLVNYLEKEAIDKPGLFIQKLNPKEINQLRTHIIETGLNVELKNQSYQASEVLKQFFSSLPAPILTNEFHDVIAYCLAKTGELQIEMLRRVMHSLPPGNKLFLVRLTKFLVLLKNASKTNQIDPNTLNDVFAKAIFSKQNQTNHTLSNTFLKILLQSFSQIFKKIGDLGEIKIDDPSFSEKLRTACNTLGNALLNQSTSQEVTRSSRNSVKGWDDVFNMLEESENEEEKKIDKFFTESTELGNLIFVGKMDEAKQFLDDVISKRAKKKDGIENILEEDGVYTGDYSNNKPHGKGSFKFKNGDVYTGEFVDGRREGSGKLVLNDGSVYVGQFKNGKPHGTGKFEYSNGDSYEGDFENDNYHGKGVYISPSNNTKYEGQFSEGMRHGKGKFKTKRGHIYYGQYENDQMCGLGIYNYANGDVYKGEFSNGKFNGKGVYTFANNSQKMEGIFKDGKFTG